MTPDPTTADRPRRRIDRRGFLISLALYILFAGAVFWAMGPEPLLGSDHLSYMRLADQITAETPSGNYFSEINSVRSFSVMLALMRPFTGSHILSMKLILAAVTVLYLLAAELMISLFTGRRWERRLFAVLSGFAVSFGVSSWGVTDSTALMPRTLVIPVMFFCVWYYLRFFERSLRYAIFPLLALFSVFHLSTFYLLAIFVLFEGFDFWFIRRRQVDARVIAFPAWLLVTVLLMAGMERAGVSVGNTQFLTSMLFPSHKKAQVAASVTASAQRTGKLNVLPLPPITAPGALWSAPVGGKSAPPSLPDANPQEATLSEAKNSLPTPGGTSSASNFAPPSSHLSPAWVNELKTRPWRNMPLPLVNIANILSSSALILLLGITGAWIAFRRGPRLLDVIMAWWVVTTVLFAFGPQTALWILRQFTGIPPINIEEIRALFFLLVPALYFSIQLFDWLGARGGRTAFYGRPALVMLYVALPLLMKSLPPAARENLLVAMTRLGVVDNNATSLANARSALGLSYSVPLYYPVQGVTRWLEEHGAIGSLVLTDRDDMIVRDFYFVGSRQEVALQDFDSRHGQLVLYIHKRLKSALAERDTPAIVELAKQIKARYVLVSWPVPEAVYRDEHFSVIDVGLAKSAR